MKHVFFLLWIGIGCSWSLAQKDLQEFSYENFMKQVMEHHPYAYRAEIVQQMGTSNLLTSRGAFDPRVFGNIDQKYFDDKQYYSRTYGGLKIPTWYGVSVEAGYSQNEGVFLNPENRTPDAGLWYAGLRVELGNGLIINQRRATFEQAKLQAEITGIERTILLNELQRDASVSYWKWQQAYFELRVYEQAFENAQFRLDAVKQAALFGDRPYIDTLEASMNLRNRSISLLQARNTLLNAELKVEFYLWSNGFIPLELENAFPEEQRESTSSVLLSHLDSVLIHHPFLQIEALNVAQQKVDLQWKREQLKPKITLAYNLINEPISGNPLSNYSPANYTWGASLSYPILTRKERGGVQMSRLKLQDQELKLKTTMADLRYTIGATLNAYTTLIDQLEETRKFTELNQAMYDAEITLFSLGESSIFMINSRESEWLKAQIQLIRVHAEQQTMFSELQYQMMAHS